MAGGLVISGGLCNNSICTDGNNLLFANGEYFPNYKPTDFLLDTYYSNVKNVVFIF